MIIQRKLKVEKGLTGHRRDLFRRSFKREYVQWCFLGIPIYERDISYTEQ